MKCPSCGTENDSANRFCDQCGARLDVGGAAAQPQASLASQPTAAAATCPSCGAMVLPGEAFCDECGTALSSAVPAPAGAASYDAPTVFAAPTPSSAPIDAAAAQGPLCPACGHVNLPGDQFCDHCGAKLTGLSADDQAAPTAAASPEPVATPSSAAPADLADANAPTVLADAAPDANAPTVLADAAPDASPPTASADAAPALVSEPPVESAPAVAAAPAESPEKQELEAEIARQQQIITQFEQMQAMFGAATPPAVTQGLADARAAMDAAQAELSALGATPAPATPAPVAPGTPMPEAAAPVSAPVSEAAAPVSAPTPEPTVVVAPTPPSAPQPRLVIEESGQELALPTDKAEIIIGREDPISGIFPEIDLTPYGGESGGVSRQHARINHLQDQWTITDLNSTNYTRVDGNKLDPSLPVPIKDGARLQFGRISMLFRA